MNEIWIVESESTAFKSLSYIGADYKSSPREGLGQTYAYDEYTL